MKIVLIAGFSNAEVRSHLTFVKDRKIYHTLVKILGLPPRVLEFGDNAPWISGLIRFFERQDGVELHVVGPHIRLKKSIECSVLGGATYHFFKTEWSEMTRLVGNYKLWKRLQLSGRYTRKILDTIEPDLVILSGAENPATSVSILSALKYPCICLCQTVYNNPDRAKYLVPNKVIQECEKDIFCKVRYFGVISKMHYDLLMQINPDAVAFKYGYSSNKPMLEPSDITKEYDFVNFALTLDLRKGAHDSVRALAIVKQKYPHVTLNLVGGCDKVYKDELVQIIEENGLNENVIFTPFFEKRSDLLLHIQKSRFAVLPCKLDNTSGTMMQSMQLGLPIVVYKTQGTPTLNKEKECALIAELCDVEDLAQKMMILLEDQNRAETLRKNAREFQVQKRKKAENYGEKMMKAFKAVLAYYQEGIAIPQNLLFNPDTDD